MFILLTQCTINSCDSFKFVVDLIVRTYFKIGNFFSKQEKIINSETTATQTCPDIANNSSYRAKIPHLTVLY